MKHLVIALFLVVAAAVVAPAATSDFATRISDFVNDFSANDCQSNPKACLEIKERDLKRLEARLSSSDRELSIQLRTVRDVRNRNVTLIEANGVFLEKGKSVLGTALPGEPIIWLGKRYETHDDFKAQLSVLFAERKRLEEVRGESDTLIQNLSDMRQKLISRRSEVSSAIAVLPAKRALLASHISLAGLEKDLSAIDGVITDAGTSQQEVEDILRSTEDLVLSRFSSGLFRAMFAMKEIKNGKEIYRRVSA